MAQRASLPTGPFMLPGFRYARGTDPRREAGPRVRQRRRCGALGHGAHARLRARAAEAALRGAAPLVSSATLRRSASMRLITRWGGADAGIAAVTPPRRLLLLGGSRAP